MLREQFILPQPIKARPVETERPIKESRSNRDSDSRREDFRSALAATGNDRQSGNHRAEERNRTELRENSLRNERYREQHSKQSERKTLDQAERQAAIEERIDRNIKNPEIRDKIKAILTNEDSTTSKTNGMANSLGLSSPGLEQKLTKLVDGINDGELSAEQAKSIISQLNALLESLQGLFDPASLDQPFQANLFDKPEQSDDLTSTSASDSELAEQINIALAEIAQLLTNVMQSDQVKNGKGNGEEVSALLDTSLPHETNGPSGTQLKQADNALSLLADSSEKFKLQAGISSAHINAEMPASSNSAQNKNPENLAWLNGVLAQAEHVKAAANLSKPDEKPTVDNAKLNESLQGLMELAKLALDNSKQLNLSESQISQLKVTLASLGTLDNNSAGKLNAAQQQTFLDLTKLIEQGQKNGQLQLTNVELGPVQKPGELAQSGPINQPFRFSQQQGDNQSSNVNVGNSNQASQQAAIDTVGQSSLNNAEQIGESGKFKLAEQIQLQTSSAVANLSQPSSESVIKTQTVEVQGVQLDRTLQAPKMENISNIRHDAMIKENILFNKQELATAMQQQVGLMMARNMKSVDIRLDPPELGSMQVRLNIGAEAASVSFVVSSQQAKDALEGSIPRLREMLEQQGMQLAESNVKKDNSGNGHNGDGDQDVHGQGGLANGDGEEGEPNGANGQSQLAYQIDSPYKIDFYA